MTDERTWLVERFEEHRPHLKAVAYRMLGSVAEAEEAVQDAWVRVSRAGADGVDNLRAWLTTIVARVCLNALQARKSRPEDPVGVHLPDPIVMRPGDDDPEENMLMADSVGLALQVVLDALSPAERLAFVLHDIFDVPFEAIARLTGRSAAAARQLASRARRRVRGASAPVPDADLARQREVVDAFFAAAYRGDFEGLMAVLDPDVVVRSDGGRVRPEWTHVRRGAENVARAALSFARPDVVRHPVIVNGAAGVVGMVNGQPFGVMSFTVVGGRIVEINSLVDPERLARLNLTSLIADA